MTSLSKPKSRSNHPNRFRLTEVKRVMRAAKQAGGPFEVLIDPATGLIRAVFDKPDEAVPATSGWDKTCDKG
jgi:hypothetical protein